MPAATPALVRRAPSSTNRTSASTWTAGWRAASSAASRQCVAARRPSSNPAAASERPGAHRHHARSASGGTAQGVQHRWGRRVVGGVAGHDDRVGSGQFREPQPRVHREAGGGGNRPRLGRAHGERVALPLVAVPEHLRGDRQVEHHHPRQGQRHDAMHETILAASLRKGALLPLVLLTGRPQP